MPLNPLRIQAICLDIDGTLMDTDDQLVQRVANWLRPLRPILANQDHHRAARRLVMRAETPANTLHGLLDRLGLDNRLALFNAFLRRRGWHRSPRPVRPVPGALEALEALQGRYRLAVVSARGAPVVHAFLNHFNLEPLFDVVVTGQSRPRTKPHPDPILWAAGQMGIPASACVMVGDTTVDILSGKAAGAQTVGVLCGFGEEDELRQAGADLILHSPADLPGVLPNREPPLS
jgi:HAD superfamily hydrolase (TIGR01509 family)